MSISETRPATYLRNLLRSSYVLSEYRIRRDGKNPDGMLVRRGRTDICIDGYPRSANSYASRAFRRANPDAVIAHHSHSLANIRMAVRWGIPAIVPIRNPADAVPSAVIASKRGNPYDEVLRYVMFYRGVLKRMEHLVIAPFEVITSDFNRVIQATNDLYGTKFAMVQGLEHASEEIMATMRNWSLEKGHDEVRNIPVPVPARDELKEKLRASIVSLRAFDDAKGIYEDIMSAVTLPAPPSSD